MDLTLTPSWGPSWGMAAYVMWWINVVMAAVASIAIPYVLTKVDGPRIGSVPPGALLPPIAALTIAAAGGVVCRYGAISASLQVPSHHRQLSVRWHRASISRHHRGCNPGSLLRPCVSDEATSLPAHDTLRSARSKKFCTADLGQLRAARGFRPVQYFIFHQRDRCIADCDE